MFDSPNRDLFLLDRQNVKVIINSPTRVEVSGLNPDYDVRYNNFAFFQVELRLVDTLI